MAERRLSGRVKKDAYHHGALKDALVAAARAILDEAGPRALTMREVARRAGVSHAAPAHHFPTVAAFLAEIGARGFDDLTAALDEARVTCGSGDPADHLVAMGCAYVRLAMAQSAVFRLMFARDSFTTATPALEASGRRAYGRLADTVRAVFPEIDQAARPPRVAAFWSLVHGHASLLIEEQIRPCGPLPAQIERDVAAASRALILGWRALDAAPG
ncbi:MAG: TetR/AcrR family transcriptional regulator [Microvirga sp.]|nr:TetR/AcrR family transcriptional regulator [Microvirga sp.]